MLMTDRFAIQRMSRLMNIESSILYKKSVENRNWCRWIGRIDALMRAGKEEIVIEEGTDYYSALSADDQYKEEFQKMKRDFKEFVDFINFKNILVVGLKEQQWYIGAQIVPLPRR